MSEAYRHVYQFKITLKGIRPPVWRRIQIPDTSTFWELEVALQNAMGWTGGRLGAFRHSHPETKGPEVICALENPPLDGPAVPPWKRALSAYPALGGEGTLYVYPADGPWKHAVRLEAILPRQAGDDYPRCTGGRRACPPEECGDAKGYRDLLQGSAPAAGFDPEHFDPGAVVFEDPAARWVEASAGTGGAAPAAGPGEAAWDKTREHLETLLADLLPKDGAETETTGELLNRIMAEHEAQIFDEYAPPPPLSEDDAPEETEKMDLGLHLLVHLVVETVLAQERLPEARVFYDGMQERGVSQHETLHLMGLLLFPLFADLKDPSHPFDFGSYARLLRRYASFTPERIYRLWERDELFAD